MISVVLNSFVAALSVFIFKAYLVVGSYDTELLSGQVVNKSRDVVSCGHQYECNCKPKTTCSTVNGKQECSTKQVCQTCDRHRFDVDWNVVTSVDSHTISRIDQQGLKEPSRWTLTKIGEPAATESSYQNYLLLSDDEYFSFKDKNLEEKYVNSFPSYPEVYDYYRVNRVFNTTAVNTSWLNETVNEWLKAKGRQKQINVVYVLTHQPKEYFHSLMSYWNGGKKNDLIVVVGINKADQSISWIDANTYARGMNNRSLISEIKLNGSKVFDKALVNTHLDLADKTFNRLPAETFSNKKNEVTTPFWFTLMVLLINLITSLLIARYMKINDIR